MNAGNGVDVVADVAGLYYCSSDDGSDHTQNGSHLQSEDDNDYYMKVIWWLFFVIAINVD